MNEGFVFAIIAALAFGVWTLAHQQASLHLNSLFGAIIISLTAVLLGSILLFPQLNLVSLYSNPRGILFAMIAGACALAIDFFALKAYASGTQVSVIGPLIIAGGVAVASLIGFFLGESFTWIKLAGIVLVIVGSGILAAVGG